jgi:hypothetical protein
MLCDTCRYSQRPGFVRRDSGAPATTAAAARADFIPCPDCGGAAIAHCCEGLREQPEQDRPDAKR